MNEGLETKTENNGNQMERIAQIYIWNEGEFDFYQLVIDGRKIIELRDRVNLPMIHDKYLGYRGKNLTLKLIGELSAAKGISSELCERGFRRYKIINGFRYDEESKEAIKTQGIPPRKELTINGIIFEELLHKN
mgnify:CR=1 FL=1